MSDTKMVIQRVFFLNCAGLKAKAQLCKGLCGRAVGRRGSGILLSSCTHHPSKQCGCWQSSSLSMTVAQGSSKTDWTFQGSGSATAKQTVRSGGRQEEWLLTLSKAYTWCRSLCMIQMHPGSQSTSTHNIDIRFSQSSVKPCQMYGA